MQKRSGPRRLAVVVAAVALGVNVLMLGVPHGHGHALAGGGPHGADATRAAEATGVVLRV